MESLNEVLVMVSAEIPGEREDVTPEGIVHKMVEYGIR